MGLQPLTVKEQKMAEDYYYLVDKFLQRKQLDPSKYYDVAIFGYLHAIQRVCRNPAPSENHNIFGLIEICMRQAVISEWRYLDRHIRRGDRESLSLDYISADTDDGGFPLYEVIADTHQKTELQIEAKDLAARAFAIATPREREVIDLVCLGYDPAEIAEILGIACSTVRRTLHNFREKAKAVWDDREVIRNQQWVRYRVKVQASQRAYRNAHKEEINAKKRAKWATYYAAHKDEINAKVRARRAAKRAEQRAQAQEQEKRRS